MTLALRKFLTAATEEERDRLAAAAGTSTSYLYTIAGGHRHAKIETVAAIERASTTMSKRSRGRLPIVPRSDLASTCAECPHFKACRKTSGA